MIPFKEIIRISKALPRCGLQATSEGNFCWIVDKKNNKVGSVHFDTAEIVIFESYEYSQQVRQAIGEEKFIDTRKDFDIPEQPPITFRNGEPSLTERGRMLYEKPTNLDKEHVDEAIEEANKPSTPPGSQPGGESASQYVKEH